MQPPNFSLILSQCAFYLGLCNIISTLSLTAIKMFLTFKKHIVYKRFTFKHFVVFGTQMVSFLSSEKSMSAVHL